MNNIDNMFTDLYHTCRQLKNTTVATRACELLETLPPVSITALGGFPFSKDGDEIRWCGQPISLIGLRYTISHALAESALLTYTNKNNKSLDDLANLCKGLGHDWAYRWVNITLLFSNFSPKVELAFARDTRFFMSWIVMPNDTPSPVFAATGSIKDWLSYLNHQDDKSFDSETREAMRDAYAIFLRIMP